MTFDESKIQEFYNKGKIVEARFAEALVADSGGEVMPPTAEQDMKSHIDLFWLYGENKRTSFDVKGARKVNRYDSAPTYDYTWLELQNVNGHRGSLYGDEAYMAFEGEKDWLVTRRTDLAKSVERSIIDKAIYSVKPQECFKKYQRYGRKDIIIKVPLSFIEENTVKRIPKNKREII